MKKFRLVVAIFISLLLFAIAGVVYFVLLGQWHGTAYAAGKTNLVKVYRLADVSEGGAADSVADTDAAESAGDADSGADVSADSSEDKNADSNTSNADSNAGTGPQMVEAGSVIRGSQVVSYLKSVEVDGVTYRKVKADLAVVAESPDMDDDKNADGEGQKAEGENKEGEEKSQDQTQPAEESADQDTSGKNSSGQDTSAQDASAQDVELYMEEASLVDTAEDTVLEREVFVRTSATIYETAGAPDIASFAPKGTHLDIIGHDELLSNGYINMYKVRYEDKDGKEAEGYIYGKYTTDTQEAADAPYNEHGEYDKAKKDKFHFELYGGEAKDLDFYPYERTTIEGNEFCRYARAMYLNAYAATHPEPYVKLIKESGCNAVVIDLKDGPLTYKSAVAKELSPTSYKNAYFTAEDLKKGVDAYRETGVYLIGRIVTFNDPNYAADHPKECIKYGGSSGWPSAYSRGVWEYNVKLAQEAVKEYGFNEIQFDYVRFPEATYEMSKSGKADFRNKYGESKAQAVQNFCFYAADQLREVGAYISVDVFGESAYSYVTAYGQYWSAISNIVDAISAMPYTDHFDGAAPWENPYRSVNNWAKRAAKQQKRLQDPAAARTWITGYNTPHWAPTVNYNEEKLKDQIRALEDEGLDGGFIPWNVLSDIGKYNQYKGIWKE